MLALVDKDIQSGRGRGWQHGFWSSAHLGASWPGLSIFVTARYWVIFKLFGLEERDNAWLHESPSLWLNKVAYICLKQSHRGHVLTSSGGVRCYSAQGRVLNRKPNLEAIKQRGLTYCLHKPMCIFTTNPDRSALFTIITWHFNFISWMSVFST